MMKKFGLGVLFLVAIAAWIGYGKYKQVYHPNVPSTLSNNLVQIHNGTSFPELTQQLFENGQIIDTASFAWLAHQMKYVKPEMRAGQFEIKPDMSNVSLIRHLRGGKQKPVRITFNYERFVEDVIGKITPALALDSAQLVKPLQDSSFYKSLGTDRENLISLFIPNTYEVYWNITEKEFYERIKKEHKKFWEKNGRLEKAEKLGITPSQVYTLASIVQRESNAKQEYPIIAGLYLNRYNRGMLLQADPTVVFANRAFELRRVLRKHTKIDDPYNTYKYLGLPPGPISLASVACIDGVLNAQDHDYIFFCAKPDNSGLHSFAKTLAGHNANARKFHAWLNKRGIR